MIVRSRAPLRIGLAGGGTDLSPYSDLYGGAILNATISLFAQATILPNRSNRLRLESLEMDEIMDLRKSRQLKIDGTLDLIKGTHNHMFKHFKGKLPAYDISTHVDVPKGSGLGASSTLTVAIAGAYREWLKLPLGEYDLAKIAYEIERNDLQISGGKQDQYAATFGGFNFMEFYKDDKVIVNPLRIRPEYLHELELNILLYYTGTSRLSSSIIEKQTSNFSGKKEQALEAAHRLKEQAILMKEALLTGQLKEIGELLDFGWQQKKKTATGISNPLIDEIYAQALKHGATGGKISGAGGGGFMMLYAPGNNRYKVIKALEPMGGIFKPFHFVQEGVTTWTLNNH
jgi:D-glycero-alpha-D-manno-heptose-7-phosphate kinase